MSGTVRAPASPPRSVPSLRRFFLVGLAWLVVLTAGWIAISPWTSYPSAVLARIGLEAGAPYWIRKVQLNPTRIDVESRLEVVTQGPAGKMRGEIDVSAKPAHYAYGLPVFLALLLAARSRALVRRALVGYLVLLPFQAFSLAFDLLKQMAMAAAGTPGALGVAQWQLEAIAYGYQFGVLVLPTLAPVVVWLVLDREFFQSIAAPWRPPAAARA